MAHQPEKSKKASPVETTDPLEKFCGIFRRSIPDEDRHMVDDAALEETARIHLKLSRERGPGEPAVSVYTPKVKDGDWANAHTIVDIVNDDMPFLVASVAAEITHKYKLIRLLLHPMVHIKRNAKGRFAGLADKPGAGAATQSHMHIQLQGTLPAPAARQLEKDLLRVLNDVLHGTRDWQAMRQKLLDCQKGLGRAPAEKYGREQVSEYLRFLDYLYNNNFTLLGYREYKFAENGESTAPKPVKGASLGLLHDDMKPPFLSDMEGGLPQDLKKLRRGLPPVTVAKVNKRSTVHRSVPIDAVAVKQFGKDGKATGECLFLGLFTSVTYSRSIQDIPLLRRKTENVIRLSGFKPGSHSEKALRHVLEKYPRDELFQIGDEDLLETCVSIMHLQERQRIALYVRPDAFGRYVSCLVYVPRDRYDTRLRLTIQGILEEEFKGVTGDFYTNLDDSPLARAMFMIYLNGKLPSYDVRKIEKRLQTAGQLWREKLASALLKALDSEEEASRHALKYASAFSVAYQENYFPFQAVFDIHKIEEALETNTLSLDLYKCKHCGSDQIRLKAFHPGKPMTLSDVLPVLENMGLRVIAENPFEVRPGGGEKSVWIHDFLMQQDKSVPAAKVEEVKAKFEEALEKIWYGEIENDGLNQLVLTVGMGWREVRILRAYVRYMRQMNYSFGARYIEQALNKNPQIANNIVKLFFALHDPKLQGKAAAQAKKLREAIDEGLEQVASLDEDRILRNITNLVEATVRTNYFQTDENGETKAYLSVKLESGKVRDLPKPVPYREIFVYSTRVEGVHLRGDVIARGGIRWSNRHEDFRTEVLGLMKAQQVKNSVIVPMGAKGGFVVKKPPLAGGRDAMLAEGIECYKIFIRGLLDITDNRKGKKVVPPKNVVCRDGEDPYLVVAADKGTASFSDIANKISLEYGHWLGDAFASGGSAGYDHKKMGITARGAWESVKRHFRELNHDIQSKPFDVVGVGDMGGDVFGNGMILSRHIRLAGAFNHMHIFCDPDPDTESSFRERERLFKQVKGWGDYNEKLLSRGGRIFLRSEKSLHLTAEIRKRFDIEAERVSPPELIQAMLRARTDLLWFGGIGTYIRASHETSAEVGDRGNDSLRVASGEIRAHVIGEGANLAITHSARIEMARRGVKLNADFIDNSGGVDSSDHEVNIKILMTEIMTGGKHKMTLAARDKLLGQMTEEIAALVLRNNYQQAQALSLMELQAAKNLSSHARFIRNLERRHGLDRKLENLPDDEEIEERLQAGKGLTRPELAILQAHAKILFSRDVVGSDIPDLPVMQDYWLIDYFPKPLREKYREEILGHRLRREIIATTMSNSLINRMGPVFVKEMMDKTGAGCADVARAYLVVRDSFGLRAFWDRIEALDNEAPAHAQLKAMERMASLVERETLWFLTRLGRKPDIKKDTADFSRGIAKLRQIMDEIAPVNLSRAIRLRLEAWSNDGLPKDLARQVALVPVMDAAFDIIRISLDRKTDLALTARIYLELGERFHIDWLRGQARSLSAADHWTAEAIEGIIEELYNCQAGMTGHIIEDMGKAPKDKKNIVESWLECCGPQTKQIEALFTELRRAGSVDMPMLIIAVQRLRGLFGG